MRTLENIEIGQKVTYKSCASTYTGTVVEKRHGSLIVIGCEAGMELWNAGYHVGDEVYAEQIVK
jgi:hypothetical protein